jgi:catechol 2,3-dioxygenase-like lactoylglutathione lyase family enzyme
MKFTIQHIELHVSSLEKAKDFYVNKLGLEILEEIPVINLLALKAGNVRISIFSGYESDMDRNPRNASSHFVFQTDDIELTYSELTAKGVVFDDKIREAPGFVRFLSTMDPDGNKIEFGQYLRDPLAKRV